MTRQLFGTDGIRGVAGQYPLDGAGSLQIGKAIGMYFAKPGESILVGYDPRESSEGLAASVIAGLLSVGVNTQLVGVVPTPALAYLTKNDNAVAGVMITASHNPYTDNGIKVFGGDGGKLPDDTEEKLNALIDTIIPDRGSGKASENQELLKTYEDFLVSTMGGASLDGLSVALDTANGATSGIAARVFERSGAKVVTLFDQPNGTNINVDCGATDTKAVQEAVINKGLDCGAAFDGDGDRLILVDEKGRQLDGDYILYILALTSKYKGVVATIMSNMGLETALSQHDITMTRTAVGDRYVLEGLEQTGYQLGGEKSGHIILPAYATTGDGMLAAIQTFKNIHESGKSLADWYDSLQLLPQALINIPLQDKSLLERADIQDYVSAQVSELGESGRVSIRPSGTEPKARVMVESVDATERATKIADTLTNMLKEEV